MSKNSSPNFLYHFKDLRWQLYGSKTLLRLSTPPIDKNLFLRHDKIGPLEEKDLDRILEVSNPKNQMANHVFSVQSQRNLFHYEVVSVTRLVKCNNYQALLYDLDYRDHL